MSYRTYSAIESGANSMEIETFALIAQTLETSLDYLILEKESDALLNDIPKENGNWH